MLKRTSAASGSSAMARSNSARAASRMPRSMNDSARLFSESAVSAAAAGAILA